MDTYNEKLDFVIAKWFGEGWYMAQGIPFRAFAALIGDPWMDFNTEKAINGSVPTGRNFIVDVENPKVQKLLDLACGPHSDTILKMIDMGMFNVHEPN